MIDSGDFAMLGPTTYHRVPVTEAWDETAAFLAVRLALPAALARAHLRPGQVVKIRTPAGEAFYALASAPDPDAFADLLVKRGGKVSDEVAAQALHFRTLEVSEPFGDGFPVDEAVGRDVLLFAAGSGIAPIRALIQHLVRHRQRFNRITLFYGQRHGAEFAYRSEHLSWERGGVRVILCPTGEDDIWEGVRGRVQEVA
ncbi:MAG TPA: oxidoreductase, partial [Anaeromyxobacter sp.]|nr:oxidoreductase [Anaeromyxobacter sp.]